MQVAKDLIVRQPELPEEVYLRRQLLAPKAVRRCGCSPSVRFMDLSLASREGGTSHVASNGATKELA